MAKDANKPAAQGATSHGESRWPASIAILIAIALYWALPGRYTMGPPWLMPVLELAILIPLSLSAPRRVAHEGRLQQMAAIAMIAFVNIANSKTGIKYVDVSRQVGKRTRIVILFIGNLVDQCNCICSLVLGN